MNSIITDNHSDDQMLNSRIDRFFNQINILKVLLSSNFYKESGFHCSIVLKELFSLIFHGKNLYRTLSVKNEELSFKKNTAYRFLNAGHFNWEKLLLVVISRLILTLDNSTCFNVTSPDS